MKTITRVLAILAAASTAAVAKDLKQDKKATTTNAPTVSAQQMNDADMDKVTAGNGATFIEVIAPNGFTGFHRDTVGHGRSPVCFNCS